MKTQCLNCGTCFEPPVSTVGDNSNFEIPCPNCSIISSVINNYEKSLGDELEHITDKLRDKYQKEWEG